MFNKRTKPTTLTQLLGEGVVSFFNFHERNQALHHLTYALVKKGAITNEDQEAFFDALVTRENLVSTGIGMAVALPHARLSSLKKFFISIGIQQGTTGIDWGAIDEVSVRLIIVIGGPVDQQISYLNILSGLTEVVNNPAQRQALLSAESPNMLLSQFQQFANKEI